MSDNFLETLIDATIELGKLSTKPIKKITSIILKITWNEHEFEEFFKIMKVKNSEDRKIRLKSWSDEGAYKLYKFKAPTGLCLTDFEKTKEPLALFMKTDSSNLEFKISEDYKSVNLFEFRFNELFEKVNLKNENDIYPKLTKTIIEDNTITWRFDLPEGIEVKDFEKKINELKKMSKKHKKNKINELKVIKKDDKSSVKLKL